MRKTDRQQRLECLHDCLRSMDLPEHKKTPVTNESLRWLARCLAERNSTHRSFADATRLLDELGAGGIRTPR